MMIKRIAASIGSVGVALSLMTPSVFAADLQISGNGVGSANTIRVKNECKVKVDQKNDTNVDLTVNSSANSGENIANGNTGGTVTINTGKAESEVTVGVTGGDNDATPPDCCVCSDPAQTQLIADNGVGSVNKIKTKSERKLTEKQSTKTKLKASLKSKAKSGENVTNGNTGSGVSVTTDDVLSTVDVTVDGGFNTLNP